MIEYGGANAHSLIPKAVPFLLQYADAENYLLRQAACYGLGVCAEHGGPLFDSFAQRSLEKLLQVIRAKDSRKGTNGSATDNAISAVYKLSVYRQTLIPKQVFGEILGLLPIDSDRLEAKIIHYRLMQHLMQNDNFASENGTQIKGVLKKCSQSKKGFNQTKSEFDEDEAILSENTRKFVSTL